MGIPHTAYMDTQLRYIYSQHVCIYVCICLYSMCVATYNIYITIPMLQTSHHWPYPRPLIISGAEIHTHAQM